MFQRIDRFFDKETVSKRDEIIFTFWKKNLHGSYQGIDNNKMTNSTSPTSPKSFRSICFLGLLPFMPNGTHPIFRAEYPLLLALFIL